MTGGIIPTHGRYIGRPGRVYCSEPTNRRRRDTHHLQDVDCLPCLRVMAQVTRSNAVVWNRIEDLEAAASLNVDYRRIGHDHGDYGVIVMRTLVNSLAGVSHGQKRLWDAVNRAGGPAPSTTVKFINLLVDDGHVLKVKEKGRWRYSVPENPPPSR